jgi:DNA polymerase bacteriophage-type
MPVLHVDIETFCSTDLRDCGVHRYAESRDFECILIGVAIDDDEVQVIDLLQGEELPRDIEDALFNPRFEKHAFNAAFEITCLSRHFGKRLDPSQWHCTSAHALYLGLPNNLKDVGQVAGIQTSEQKLSSGLGLIRRFCMPCKPSKANGSRTRNLPHHAPDAWEEFKLYCRNDVQAERAIGKKLSLFPMPEAERKLWVLDQSMNATGIRVDRQLVEHAIDFDDSHRLALLAEATSITGLDNPNSRNQLLSWLRAEDENPNITELTKKSVPVLLAQTDNERVRRALQLRQELAKTSVSKYHAMARAICADDCLRGLTQYYGASRTGRWAGRLVQVQNLPQNKLKDLPLARDLLRSGEYEILSLVFGNVPDTLSQLIRTAFVPRDGHTFLVVDFNAIEARVLSWLSASAWRLEVFRTHGRIYEASAEKMFGLAPGSVTKASPYRNKGKVAELALGYGGGAGALKAMGAIEMGLQESELEGIKNVWREANAEIVSFWRSCERAAVLAVADKTKVSLPVAMAQATITFSYEKGFLFIELPSGRRLAYVKPRIEQEDLYVTDANGGSYVLAQAGALTYEGIDQKSRQWRRIPTWSGRVVENITQAIARDCLRESIFALDDAGFKILTTIHDEVILEIPESGPLNLKLAEGLMSKPISWAPSLPMRADGFETPYYQKEVD